MTIKKPPSGGFLVEILLGQEFFNFQQAGKDEEGTAHRHIAPPEGGVGVTVLRLVAGAGYFFEGGVAFQGGNEQQQYPRRPGVFREHQVDAEAQIEQVAGQRYQKVVGHLLREAGHI